MITLTNILNETSRAVLKVIQGPLPGFSGKSWRMQLMLDPFFPAWGLVPRSTAKSEEENGARAGVVCKELRKPES